MRAGNAGTSRKRGFTIIEMLAVLFILAIIVALIASVSNYVMNEANKKDTRAAMAVIREAIDIYLEVNDVLPTEAGGSTVTMFTELKGNEQTFEIIHNLPDSAFGSQNPRTRFYDAWENELRYYRSEGRGGGPVLISGGPDGNFSTTDDNIRSDQP